MDLWMLDLIVGAVCACIFVLCNASSHMEIRKDISDIKARLAALENAR